MVVVGAGIVATFVGCAQPGGAGGAGGAPADAFKQQAQDMMTKPAGGAPQTNATSFAQALRCMDGVFKSWGARGVTVVLEDIPDSTGKVKVGAKDMFISATSSMTRGSRAISLIPWDKGKIFEGRDEIVKAANFAVQGSISQFDETMLRKQSDGAVCIGPLCAGAAESDSFSGLSLDLNMIETRGLTLIPGVSSKNYVLIRRKGKGYDGDLTLKKFGVQYNFVFNSSDGQGQALRSLVELSTIELYGRLLKIPYWSCLGLTDADAGVSTEIDDWWETLRGDIPSLISWLQFQMRVRGLYKGEVDGQLDDQLKQAVGAYKVAMGLPDDLNIDATFFRRYLAADHAKVQPAAMNKLAASGAGAGPGAGGAATAAAAATGGAAGVVIVSSRGANPVYRRGDPVELEISVNRDGYLYCYLIDEARTLQQFFPNPAQTSAAMRAGGKLQIPGRFPFKLVASRKGITETVACVATPQDLGRDGLVATQGIRDVNGLRSAMAARVGHQNLALGVFDVQPQ
jgi:hypothetical protein